MQYKDYLWAKYGWKIWLLAGIAILLSIFVLILGFESASKGGVFTKEPGMKTVESFRALIGLLVLACFFLFGFCWRFWKTKNDIYILFQDLLGPQQVVTSAKVMPKYRFPDLFNFLQEIAKGDGRWIMLCSQHYESLQGMLANNFYAVQNRKINSSEVKSWPVAPGRTSPIPQDVCLIMPFANNQAGMIIRIRMDQQMNWAHLEIAAQNNQASGDLIDLVEDFFQKRSIYKNQTIQFVVNYGTVEVLGSFERTSVVSLEFVDKPPVSDDDIILDEETCSVLDRCVVDFHNRREDLIKHGLAGRRGVIFYGPPGTGKTYTCRYLAGKMKDSTTIIVAGQALTAPKQFCELARSLQPALVVLEDVDLVYGSRERNFNITALGDLMDELDGFGQTDKVIFILTTNSIDRVEDAIKDRPGRISQCVYFGQPVAQLRQRYLANLLSPYHSGSVQFEKLVAETDGATQAFLKELVFRSVQIASQGSINPVDGKVILKDEHLMDAISQIRRNSGRSGATIMGFRTT